MTQLIDLGKLRFFFAGEYDPTTQYEVNDVVKYGGNVYVYVYTLAAAGRLPTDTAYWRLMIEGIRFQGAYSPTRTYRVGEGVTYGGTVYLNIADSTAITPTDADHWTKFLDGIQYEGAYSATASYQRSDLVTYGPGAYVAKADTTGVDPSKASAWSPLVSGVSVEGAWSASTAYVPGQVVAYGAKLYRAIANTTANAPADTTGVLDAARWQLYVDSTRYLGAWTASTAYYVGDIVNRGGSSYIAIASQASTASFPADLAANFWRKYNSGIRWRGTLTPATDYRVDDLFTDGLNTWIVTAEFASATSTIPADYAASIELLARGADYLPPQAGNAARALYTDGTTPQWVFPGRVAYLNLVAGALSVNRYHWVNTAINSGTLTLPASPAIDDFVVLADLAGSWGYKPPTLDPGPLKINGVADTLILNLKNATVTCVYTGATYGWRTL